MRPGDKTHLCLLKHDKQAMPRRETSQGLDVKPKLTHVYAHTNKVSFICKQYIHSRLRKWQPTHSRIVLSVVYVNLLNSEIKSGISLLNLIKVSLLLI